MPVLGNCFGAQALSAALGGTVERAPRPELGWVRVDTDAPDVVASGPWFEWHRDRFTVPPGGVALARTDAGVQAFRFGNCMGVQFHPEVDVTLLGSWLGDDGTPDALFGELGVDPCELLTETAAREQASAANACRLVDHFLEEVAR
jgi:GMP synthase-like glutamine amidotransferase